MFLANVATAVASISLSMIVARNAIECIEGYVGVTSMFLYGREEWWVFAVRMVSVFVCAVIGSWKIVLNPLFISALAMESNDVVFVAVHCVFIKSGLHPTLPLMILAGIRQLLVEPEPSISCFWLLDTHFYAQFRATARIVVIILEMLSLFLSRRFHCPLDTGVLISSIFEPAGDWITLTLLCNTVIPWLNTSTTVNTGILTSLVGLVFFQSSCHAWWTLRTGNANFALVGSALYTIGLMLMLYARTDNSHRNTD